jgi:hypothetical protein
VAVLGFRYNNTVYHSPQPTRRRFIIEEFA